MLAAASLTQLTAGAVISILARQCGPDLSLLPSLTRFSVGPVSAFRRRVCRPLTAGECVKSPRAAAAVLRGRTVGWALLQLSYSKPTHRGRRRRRSYFIRFNNGVWCGVKSSLNTVKLRLNWSRTGLCTCEASLCSMFHQVMNFSSVKSLVLFYFVCFLT